MTSDSSARRSANSPRQPPAPRGALRGLLTAAVAAVATIVATVLLWLGLMQGEQAQAARTAEAVSYAARSQLVRRLDVQLRALRDLAVYWATYGRQPRDQWADDARIALAHFVGMEYIAWASPASSIRFYTTSPEQGFDRQPTEAEWDAIDEAMTRAMGRRDETVLGPMAGENGEPLYQVVVPVGRGDDSGTLTAVVDARETLAELLEDESPGYSIGVYWDGVELYQRGSPAASIPDEWVREGLIRLSMGPLWRVVHAPTDAQAQALRNSLLPAVLVAGISIAGLLGGLLFENSRARARTSELFELNRELESKVLARTQALEETAADLRMLSESVSHDMRSPLQGIRLEIGMLERFLAHPAASEARQSVERLSRAAQRLIAIAERLTGLSEVSHSTFEPKPVALADLARSVFGELTAAGDRPSPELVIDALPARVTCDERLMRILLTNLLHNALKHSRTQPQPRIHVGCEETDDGSVFYVRDNGTGFPAVDAERIFRPFVRGPGGDSKGLGLGLALAAGVARRHGGRIWAKSNPDRGATVCFTLGA